MNRYVRIFLAYLIVGSIIGLGVYFLVNRDRPNGDSANPQKQAGRGDDDKTALALDIFRQSGEASQYREGLNLLSPHLTQPDVVARLTLSPESRALFKDEAKLTPAELLELESTHYRVIDAVHVSSAALFRDAARSLEIPGLSELAQAEFAFDWVTRRVLYFEQQHESLPPAYVLRAGHGSAADRGLVFLALVHQLRLEGCLLSAPDAKDAPLVGVLVQKKLYIFDTRLGLPVPGPGGKGIATWDEVVKDPGLLKDSKLTPEQVAKLTGRMALPLEALAPRMSYLESLLQGEEAHIGRERLAVYHDALQLKLDLQAAGLTHVGFWEPALRLERTYASVEEGGADQTHFAMFFAKSLVPWPPILRRYQELRIFFELPPAALEGLLMRTSALLERYDREPGELLIRGKIDVLPRRLERARTAVEDAEFADPQTEQALLKEAAVWRERVKDAYLAAQREPDGGQKVGVIWEEDQYLTYLLQPEIDAAPRNLTKKTLSKLVLNATRESLGARANWYFASLCQDKAERLRQAGGNPKLVRDAWLNARGAWTKYLDRNNLGPGIFAASIPELQRHAQRRDTERALGQWEYLHRELHHYAAARLEQARAMEQLGQDPNPVLDQLKREINQLLQDEALAKDRAGFAASGLLDTPGSQRRWALLMRDWAPDGNLAWLLETARLSRKTAS
jgi:hypothetical protein